MAVRANTDDFDQINKLNNVLSLMGERIRSGLNKNSQHKNQKRDRRRKHMKEWMDDPKQMKTDMDLGDLMRTRDD